MSSYPTDSEIPITHHDLSILLPLSLLLLLLAPKLHLDSHQAHYGSLSSLSRFSTQGLCTCCSHSTECSLLRKLPFLLPLSLSSDVPLSEKLSTIHKKYHPWAHHHQSLDLALFIFLYQIVCMHLSLLLFPDYSST